MMTLLSAPASPFGRRVKMTAILKGVIGRIAIEAVDTSQPLNSRLRSANPLQKIPVLILEDGSEIYDSRVICEYLDMLAPAPRLIPDGGMARIDTLRRSALADGIMEAAVLIVYETRFRPEPLRSATWTARQQSKIDTALDYLEATPPVWSGTPDLGHVSLAAALGYLDFRHGGAWRSERPRLVAWLNRFASDVTAFSATAPH
jgi:glutathione S-transferase